MRPKLESSLSVEVFQNHYYLKEELVDFCKKTGIPFHGGKLELESRIETYLKTGNIQKTKRKTISRNKIKAITPTTIIEEDIICSEIHRTFFKQEIGASFSFNVSFQKWLKANAGKTYDDAIVAYIETTKQKTHKIDKQFEYNTYIRDFFKDNKGKSLQDAIKCWKYKKSLYGHNRYEKEDLKHLKEVNQ